MKISIQMRGLLAVVFLMLLPGAAGAQGHHHHPFRPTAGKFPLIPDLGHLHHKVTTDSDTAQAYFDQGLTLIYGFNYDGAYASFREALAADSKLAMAEWGMALALGANINIDIDVERMRLAVQHIEKAQALASGASDPDREYIAALGRRYSTDPKIDRKQLAENYKAAMEPLWKNHWQDKREDPDAATLYAESWMDLRPWDLWQPDGTPYPGTLEIVNILKSVIDNPATADHVGAVHYHLHVLEPSPRWREAEDDAKKLRTLVPASGHLVHMPSHIYLLQRDYEKAAQSNLEAIKQDLLYKKTIADDGYVGHYLSHNIHFLAVARSLQNNYKDAIMQARDCEATVNEHIQSEPGLEHYLATPTLVLARFGRWDELIHAPKPDGERRIAYAMWLWGTAAGLAGNRDQDNARRQQVEFRKAIDTKLPWGNNPSKSILELADLDLSARIAAASGDKAKEAEFLALAACAERKLSYDEPPPWIIVSEGRYPAKDRKDCP